VLTTSGVINKDKSKRDIGAKPGVQQRFSKMSKSYTIIQQQPFYDDDENNDTNDSTQTFQEQQPQQVQEDGDDIVHNNFSTNDDTTTKRISNIPTLVCAFLASATTGGTTYAFGLYSNALKRSLDLSQSELDTISTCFFFAGLLSFVPGYCSDRYGPRIAMIAGACSSAIMLSSYWMFATQYIILPYRSLLVPTLSLLGVCIFLSSGLVTGAVFKVITSCCSYPTGTGSKGSAVGIAKGYVGLGAGMYACIFESIRFNNNHESSHRSASIEETDTSLSHHSILLRMLTSAQSRIVAISNSEESIASSSTTTKSDLDFLLMAACFSIGCVLIPGYILLPKTPRGNKIIQYMDESTPYHFRTLYVALLVMALFIIGKSIESLYDEDDDRNNRDPNETNHTNNIQYGVPLFLFSLWAGPILSLLHLPRNNATTINSNNDDVDEDVSTVEQHNNSLGTLNSDEERSLLAVRQLTNGMTSNDPFHEDTVPPRNGIDDISESDNHDTLAQQQDASSIDNNDPNADKNHNKNLVQMLQTPSAILMLFTSLVLVGAGTVITNNIGQMVESLGFEQIVTPAAMSIFSVAQAFSRIATGTISESALKWKCCSIFSSSSLSSSNSGRGSGIPRPFFFIIASIISCIGHFVLSIARSEFLFLIGCTLTGISFGMVWPLLVLCTGELFGSQNVGANYMFFDGFTSATGTLLLSKCIAQYVYESHIIIDKHSSNTDSHTCIGTDCFHLTHVIISTLSLCCIVTGTLLVYTSRSVYSKHNINNDH
jgi:Nodulin-like/Major Facilitator Superfamily